MKCNYIITYYSAEFHRTTYYTLKLLFVKKQSHLHHIVSYYVIYASFFMMKLCLYGIAITKKY